MFVFGYFFIALAQVIGYALTIYMWIIIIHALLSWVSPDPYNPIVRAINNLTEPVLYQIRRRLPVVQGGFDFSPIIVLLAIMFLRIFLVQNMLRIGYALL